MNHDHISNNRITWFERLIKLIFGWFTLSEKQRTTDWFLTFTAKKFYPTQPLASEVCIEDIAHSLARICRFNGHSVKFYSVAQHSVMVSYLVPPELAFKALLHDAPEAYCGDMVRPLKYQLKKYLQIEDRLWKVVAEKFGFPSDMEPEIKSADNVVLLTERRDICSPSEHGWSLEDRYKPLPYPIQAMTCEESEQRFLTRYYELQKQK